MKQATDKLELDTSDFMLANSALHALVSIGDTVEEALDFLEEDNIAASVERLQSIISWLRGAILPATRDLH